MFNQSIQRVGFACKYMHSDQTLRPKLLNEAEAPFKERGTTNKWLAAQSTNDAETRLWEIMQHNTASLQRLIGYVGSLPAGQRMLRISSGQLPYYTHKNWNYFYQQPDVVAYAEREYAKAGQLARDLDVRLSMHPGQFTVLASDRDEIVDASIFEMEYHANIAKWMGFGQQFQDFKINVHMSGKQGASGIRAIHNRLSPELRNMMTIENDEYSSGITDVLEVADLFAIVFDTHHHWVNSNEFMAPDDERFQRVIESWRGVRPAMHYSVSRPEYLVEVADDQLPVFADLKAAGFASTKLRAHSDYYHHTASNEMIAQFWPYADIMAESKAKNLASTQLYNTLMENFND